VLLRAAQVRVAAPPEIADDREWVVVLLTAAEPARRFYGMTDRGRAPVLLVSAVVMCSIALAGRGAQTQPLKQSQSPKTPAAKPEDDLPPQTVLVPGLFLFQTRTRDGSCNDAQRTGYVTSAVATLDGVPGARTMTMQLLSSKYWPTWTLKIAADGVILGTAYMNGAKDDSAGVSTFEIRPKKERFQGIGARSYASTTDGKPVRCTLNYDALLKPLD
jgi:hypothetical protein